MIIALILVAFTKGTIVGGGLIGGMAAIGYIAHGIGHALEGTGDRIAFRFEAWARQLRYRHDANQRVTKLGRVSDGWAPRDEPRPWPERPARKVTR